MLYLESKSRYLQRKIKPFESILQVYTGISVQCQFYVKLHRIEGCLSGAFYGSYPMQLHTKLVSL